MVNSPNEGTWQTPSALSMDAVDRRLIGHPGMPMGMADAATALFAEHLKFDAAAPDWPDRDRFVLSAGHGVLIYALLHLTGYADAAMDRLRNSPDRRDHRRPPRGRPCRRDQTPPARLARTGKCRWHV